MSLTYTSNDNLISGLPLGGIGCGTLQLFPDGTRGVFTGLNNWENPLGNLHWFRQGPTGDYRVANPFAIYVENGNKKVARFLQTTPLDRCPAIEEIEFSADFPIANLKFKDKDIPINIDLVAFSPFIKEDYKNSGLPCAIYQFKIHNPQDYPVTISILASGINPVGNWTVGRFNKVIKKDGLIGVEFLKRHYHPYDVRRGDISLSTKDTNDCQITFMGEWPYAARGFRAHTEDRRFDAWKYFAKDGTLPNTNTEVETGGEKDEWLAALAVKFTLKPKQRREIPFYYTWFMPKHYLGHRYQNWFKDSWAVAKYIDRKKGDLLKKTRKWQDIIKQASLSEWLKDALINNLYVYTSASWWTKDGSFALYENTVKYPLMDSLDVRYYGTLPLAIFFPELEKKAMLQFMLAQHKDGYIPHDLGKSQLNCPSNGTSAGYLWKDLCPKYILMVYRDYLWTRDEKFLNKIYPSLKKAMEWEFRTDKNGDFLPDNEGADATYDLWDFHGVSSYTSSIFLTSLLAMQKMSAIIKDRNYVLKCRDWFNRGVRSFENKLWNGSYYIAACIDDSDKYEASIAGQLNGQWYAHILGLGYILSENRIKKAVESMLNLNVKASKFGAVNSVFSDGSIDNSSYHAENIWAGETYALASLAIFEGFINAGLRLAEKTWIHFSRTSLNPWSQPDVIFAANGKLGDGELYLRNLAIWSVVFALARHNNKARKFLLRLNPRLKV